jgi:chromate reductase, NAD(P)H dehydrogenase (quinone)
MKIFAFAASNSRQSVNKKLLQFVCGYFKEAETELADLNSYEMPIYSADRERETGIPQAAIDFAAKIDAADCLIISFAEHNGAYTAAFKNIFDWVSRIPGRKAFGDKPMLLTATSPGARGGAGVLDLAQKRMPFSGGRVLGVFSLPSFNNNFSENTGITNEEYHRQLEAVISSVKQQLRQTVN